MTLLAGVRNWLTGSDPAGKPPPAGAPARPVPNGAAGPPDPSAPPAPGAAAAPAERWSDARITVSDALWGEGFIFPGGAEETLRLARPLGLTAAASLLLLGAGGGGPSRALAMQLGVWVTGFEADARLAAVAAERNARAGLARRAPVEAWDPDNPVFSGPSHHHAIALQPLRGARPEPVLAAMRGALKPGGHLVLTELVAESPLDPAEPVTAGWLRLEQRAAALPTETAINRSLGQLGYDIRVAEDISDRHAHLAALGWRQALAAISGRPSVDAASALVREAELWLLRLRLIRARKMRLMRWHAIGPPAAGRPFA
jgi:SAM-dependent methyltransferase